MSTDHIWPKAEGGTNCINNLRIMCVHCNTSKNKIITASAKVYKGKDKKSIASAIKRKIVK
jgi:5-methylcytosine-specific restriction endonuclease McrA